MKKKSIIFFVSALKATDRGHGGVAKLVDDIAGWLADEEYDVRVIAAFGHEFRDKAPYTLKILMPTTRHSSDSNLISRSLFWLLFAANFCFWSLTNYKALRNSTCISCNPGASLLLPFMTSKLIIWENVAFFSRRKTVDRLRLRLAFMLGGKLVVPTREEIDSIHVALKKSAGTLPILHVNNWIRADMCLAQSSVRSQACASESSREYGEKYYRFVAAGQLDRRKGFHTLLEAADMIQKKSRFQCQFRIDIYGQGVGLKELKLNIKQLGLNDVVELKGFSNQLLEDLSQSHFFCLPSLYEGFPLVLISAQALGMPAVVTNCCHGISEVIKNGENGYVCAVNSPAAFAAGMVKVMRRSRHFLTAGSALSVLYSKPYCSNEVFPQWLQLLESQ